MRDVALAPGRYFTGSIARTMVPSRSTYAVADGPQDPARLA